MTLADYVSVTITRDSVGVSRAGFGVPLILSYNAAWSGDRVRSYTALSEVDDDFATTSVEYLCAQKLLGQNPKLQKIKIARCSNKPTQRYNIVVGTPVNNHVYTVTAQGEGFGPTSAPTVASDGSATNDEVVALLVTALNGVASKNYTAAAVGSAGSQTCQVTANAAGGWFSLEIAAADIGNLTISQNHADPGVAADISAILNEDDDWYFLLTNYNSKLYVGAAEAAVEALDLKQYAWDANDTTCVTVAAASADDTFEDALDLAYGRSSGWYHPSPANFLAAAEIGRCAPLDPGAVNFALKTLSGVTAVARTSTHRTNILARKANSYESVSGRSLTYYGTVFSGEYIDVVRDLDYVKDDIAKSIFEVLAGADKVPFTDEGIAIIEGALRGALARAQAKGVFTAGWTVTVPKASAVSVGNKTARTCPDIKFTATLQGAINKAVVSGVVSV